MHKILTAIPVFAALLALPSYAAEVWKIAPPPPVSLERDSVADLTARRRAAMEQVGEKGILILYAAEPRNYAGDVDWPYRQENNFYYLTGITQPGSILAVIPGAKIREVLFMPPSNPAQESWTGHILTPAEVRRISGIEEVWDVRRFHSFLSTLLPQAASMLTTLAAETAKNASPGRGKPPEPTAIPVDLASAFEKTIGDAARGEAELHLISRGRSVEFRREIDLGGKFGSLSPAVPVKDAGPVFTSLRRIKSAREIDLLQHAVDITAEAFQRVYAVATPGTWEYEIQAQFEFTFLRRNAHWGYPSIVGSGVNATTLHYDTNKNQMKSSDLLLMDAAAEFAGYSADVTRTIPVNGKFTPEQAEIYRLVWEAQQAGIRAAVPGRTMTGQDSVQAAAADVLKKGLYKLGLMTDPTSDQQLRTWFFHGIGHGIGLNVHDAGGRELAPGMTITVEPGLYFRPDVLDHLPKTEENEKFIAAVRPAFEKYKGIGVRIEDDLLITNGPPKNLSSAIPSRLEDVEASIARLRKALKSNPLP